MEKISTGALYTCDECNKSYSTLIQLGEPDEWGSRTVLLCKECLEKALDLLKRQDETA